MNTLESLRKVEVDKNKDKLLIIEKKIGFKIPSSFSDFLVSYNVVKPKLTCYMKGNIIFNINYFFGFSDDKYQDFPQNYSAYLNRMPQDIFPIASVDGGDLLCMDKNNEHIYYWFHEKDDRGLNGNRDRPVKISNNLYGLIEALNEPKNPSKSEIEFAKKHSKTTKVTPTSLKFKNEARAKKGLPPLTMDDF